MFNTLLLFATGFVALWTAYGDYVRVSTPEGQPSDRPPYVLIEEPWEGGVGNWNILGMVLIPGLTLQEMKQVTDYNARVNYDLPLCPKDGNPHCRDCRPGKPDDYLVMTQCCFSHHWAWKNNRTLRDILPYRFHLDPVADDPTKEPYYSWNGGPGGVWHTDPCTGEPATDITNGSYIPLSLRQKSK
ncbi:uncharacterized protein LOC129598486 [Paramacrobiotus metropolitanus]|uniref:uncharacterized protein LOC129598486 n=1 Tax=Paramacrobiotus metropolitanus TaxID=2943436 RepID=UPI002445826F|nr:uncharacterized protein LOC129598486 [Paramacrobiotus metropolitanus]